MITQLKNIFFILFLLPHLSFAQTTGSRFLLRNSGIIDGQQTISIKWYSPELMYSEGVNIYRKEENSAWIKVNAKPIKRLDSIPISEYVKDNDLNFFIPAIIKESKEDLQGIFMINVLIKSFQNEAFSRFLGIQYEDNTVVSGRTYLYKVVKLKGSTEIPIGEVQSIKAGAETIEEPLKNITMKADTNKVKIKWLPEEQRFYAVNVYRQTSSTEWKKLNEVPVMISKYRDSLGRYQYPAVFFMEDSLLPGSYAYQLAGVDFFGRETKRSASFIVEIKDIIPPPAPESLEDSINNLDVRLSWKSSTSQGLVGFNIYRSIKSDGPFIKINQTLLQASSRFYIDHVPRAGAYYYFISSVDAAGNEGRSHHIFSEVHDIVPPGKPIGVSVKVDTGKITLSWKQNMEPDLSGYRIYRTINKNDSNRFVLLNTNPITTNSFTDILPKNTKNAFLYKIVAIDSSYNKSLPSDLVQAALPDIIPPVRPYLKDIRGMEHALLIQWIQNKDSDLAGYNIYRAAPDEAFQKLNTTTISGSNVQFKDDGVKPLTRYRYYLVALDSAGNSSQPSEIWTGQSDAFSSSIIMDIKLSYKAKQKVVQLSWNYVPADSFLGYVIYRKSSETEKWKAVSERVTKTDFTDKGLMEGKTYYYEIRVYNTTGIIIHSDIKKITL